MILTTIYMRTVITEAILFLTLILFSNQAFAQQNHTLKEASALHRDYRFEEAKGAYEKILESTTDSLVRMEIEEAIIQCENGISLLHYAVTPNVLIKKQFPTDKFYLHISGLEDKSWLAAPNQMMGANTHPYYNAIYYPNGAQTIYYSAPDNSGSWNIYEITNISGDIWSEPKILGENITSSGDEIFPMISPSGKELYFASNGHYGMGGFDLYVSHWDEDAQDWGVPENLGFPYSSTADDIFFINTPDGQFSILASTRSSSNNSEMTLYAMEYTPTPIKREMSDIEEVQKVAKLNSSILTLEKREEVKEKAPEAQGMSEYAQLVSNVRALKGEMDENFAKQEENRLLYESITNEDDKAYIRKVITTLEADAIAIKDRLDKASAAVQAAEMDFLAKGIIPQLELPEEDVPQKEPQQKGPTYKFANNTYREAVEMTIEIPEPEFDYSFKILDEAQFAEDNALPDRLVYQIQLMVVSKPASKKSLKGLSPIFELKQPSGKYLYTVGLWGTHAEALKHLNQVRKRGFPKAYIVAYNKGKAISVKNARILERKKGSGEDGSSFQLVIKGYADGIPTGILTAIRGACDKDLAKSAVNGQTIYMVGPFSNKDEADKLKDLLFGLGVEGLSVESIKK